MIYLDNHATTPIDPRVLNTILPYLKDKYGNPASTHSMGDEAREAIELSKEQVSRIINSKSDNIFFTGSATEANNIVIKTVKLHRDKAFFDPDFFYNIITTKTEHSSILSCVSKLHNYSAVPKYLSVDRSGNIDYNELEEELKFGRTILVSIMAANNEIGTIHDIYKIGKICKKYNVIFHTDASQAIGKLDIDVELMNIDALTLSGHKIYGPKGVGALYLRNLDYFGPILDGGYQNIISSGTQNVPFIVGIGKACSILDVEENKRLSNLRDMALDMLNKSFKDLIINGTMTNRLCNNLNFSIPGVSADILVRGLDDVMISGSSACSSGDAKISHVIKALDVPFPECAIRIGLGRFNTEDEVFYSMNKIIDVAKYLRRNG